ncbi:AfsA-related hotdog domain-containing protein [Microbacterium lacticum]
MPDISPALSFTYSQTLDRKLVNRRSVSEVFLTDFHPVDAEEWIIGAQLPLGHGYFSDHRSPFDFYDPLLILECCRQAGTYGGYTQFGNSSDTVNMVSSLHLSIDHPELLKTRGHPGHLIVHVRARDVVRKAGRTRKATPWMTLFLDEEYLGHAAIPVNLASPNLFRALRLRMRNGEPVLTNELEEPAEPLVNPSRVGRRRERNVLLAGAEETETGATALLRLSPRNTNILDHDYDHIPAMALADAAIQLAAMVANANRETISTLDAHFDRFTEVDSPTRLTGQIVSAGAFRVTFEQEGSSTGRIDLTFY